MPSTTTRRTWLRWPLQALYAACLLALMLLPAHRYGWMRELDPGFGGPLPEDGSGNRVAAAAVLLALALLAQLGAGLLARGARGRWGAVLLALVAVAVWGVRFGAG